MDSKDRKDKIQIGVFTIILSVMNIVVGVVLVSLAGGRLEPFGLAALFFGLVPIVGAIGLFMDKAWGSILIIVVFSLELLARFVKLLGGGYRGSSYKELWIPLFMLISIVTLSRMLMKAKDRGGEADQAGEGGDGQAATGGAALQDAVADDADGRS